MAGLIDWLPVWNMALGKIGKPLLTNPNLAIQNSDEARKVSLYWNAVLGKVLADHDIFAAVKTVFLGSATTELTPTAPVGSVELSSSNRVRLYCFTLPPYSAVGAEGSVPFDIVRTLQLSTGSVFDPRGKQLIVPEKITAQNVYADVIVKPTAPEAGADDSFCWALAIALAYEIASQVSGKDRYRDLKLEAEYEHHIANCRYYNATQGQPSGETGWWSKLSDKAVTTR